MVREFETRLGAYMRQHGITTEWLAAECGVTPSSVSRWCTGASSMRNGHKELVMEALRKWWTALYAPPDDLLDDQLESLPIGRSRHLYATREEQIAAIQQKRADERAEMARTIADRARRSGTPYDQLVGRR